jgi:membrane protein DedA with SNARE-associated domain
VFALLSLFVGTFVSEDVACISAGLLVQRGDLDAAAATLACALGIVIGDVGLWAIGRVCGEAALAWPHVARALQRTGLQDLRAWLERHAAGAIVGSRFLPGTRLPLYVVAGFARLPIAVFALWAFVGAALWTPAVVLLTASLGDAFIAVMAPLVGAGWLSRLVAAAGIFLLMGAARTVIVTVRRNQAASAA